MKRTENGIDVIFIFRVVFQVENIDFNLFNILKPLRNEIARERLVLNFYLFFVPGGGILVARWQVASTEGHTLIDSGFRADDKDDYQRWEALRGDAGASDTTGIPTSSTEENQ